MKVIIAIDSFKGCLTSKEANEAAAEGIRIAYPDAEIVEVPVSDGGEGYMEAFHAAIGGRLEEVTVRDPLMRPIKAKYLLYNEMAVIEIAQASGLTLLTNEERNPMVATSYGTGQLVADAVRKGAKHIIVGLGGSATSDAGIGMLHALIDALTNGRGQWDDIEAVKDVTFTIASDVKNPLYGENGAAHVFAPQKFATERGKSGATPEMILRLDERARKFAELSAKHFGYDRSQMSGAGAAGGLGYAFLQYLNAKSRSGIQLLLDTIRFKELVADADLIITGEGSADRQTLMGKLPMGILEQSGQVPVCLIAGRISDREELLNAGFARVECINPPDLPLEEALKKEVAQQNISKLVRMAEGERIYKYNTMMKKTIVLFALLGMMTMASAQTERLLGGDVSLLPSYEQQGTVYKDFDGRQVKLLPFLKKQGWNCIRVRLFVDPLNAPDGHKGEGVCQDLNYIIGLCRQIKKAGMKVMLDFHYSDTWADPGKQFTPKRWEGCDREAMTDSVYAYTRASLLAMKKAGVSPELIQVGNEITNGMLWPTGKLYPKEDTNTTKEERWQILCDFLKAGSKACREVCPKAQIIIHTEKAGDWDVTKTYYQHMRRYGVDYDIIGLSYYPMWHKSIPNLGKTLENLAWLFPDKPVMIVEAAAYYSHERDPWAKPDQYAEFYPISVEGQTQFTHELVEELNRHHNVTGLFWWFPEENAFGNTVTKGWLNRGLFDNHTGKALPAMKEFGKFRH